MRSLLTTAALACLCMAAPAAAAAAAAAAAPARVAPLAFTRRVLPNGLRVFALPDPAGSTVAVQVWYDVGSRDDPRGRSGFAHMFEHLMFKQTRDMPSEAMDRLTEDVGGENNASTNDDYTEFNETAPAGQLERLIWAEAERMGSLVVDQGDFTSERHVVEEELRSDAARPYGELFYRILPETTYRVYPYARPTLGTIAELDSATVDDVRAFHALYYRPDNAVLVVSGKFDPAELDRWIDRYLAPIPTPRRPIPRVGAVEPPRTAPTRTTVHEPNTPLPAVSVGWLIPPTTDPDHAVLDVIDGILSGGESARFFQTLVYRDQLAAQAELITDTKKSTGSITAVAIMAGGRTAAQGEAALRREVARLRDAPVADEELARARNQIVTATLRERETAAGRAGILAASVILDGDPHAADRRLAAVQAVSAADVQRVARALLADDRSSTVYYLPAEQAPRGVAAAPVGVGPGVVTVPLVAPADVPVVLAASAAERVAPPAPGPAVTPSLPTPVERRLANGLTVVVVERHGVPIVTADLVAGGGSAADPKSRAGLAELSAALLTKGTTTRSATQIASAVESLGGSIGGDARWDGQSLALTVKSDELAPALAVFADVARHPVFAQAELDRSRTQAIDDLAVTYKDPGALARLVAARAVFGDAPYGHPAAGTPASLRAITRADVLGAYQAAWRPDRATLILVGDVGVDDAVALAGRLFGDWRADGTAPAPPPAAAAPQRPRLIVVDLPDAPQAAVAVSRRGIARSDPRYYPLLVANTVLGSGFSSRLNQEVRIKRGLAYGAGSGFDARRTVGPLSAVTQTKNPTAPEVIALITAEMRRMGSEPVPAAELAARKAALAGDFGRAIETTDDLAGLIAGLVTQRVPLDEISRYAPAIEAVGAGDVQRVSAALLDPAPASVVVVGDARQFLPALAAAGLKPDVIPAASLDLDRPALP